MEIKYQINHADFTADQRAIIRKVTKVVIDKLLPNNQDYKVLAKMRNGKCYWVAIQHQWNDIWYSDIEMNRQSFKHYLGWKGVSLDESKKLDDISLSR